MSVSHESRVIPAKAGIQVSQLDPGSSAGMTSSMGDDIREGVEQWEIV